MFRLTAYSLIGLMALSAGAETFRIDTGHAEIGFAVKHMKVSNTKGKFNTFEGTLDYDLATQTLKSAKGTIKAASIDTNNKKRDDHLRNADFFNTEKFPEITFQSTSIKKTGENTFEVTGRLNILGKDREVVLPVVITGPVKDRRGGKRMGVAGTTVLNRRTLGITNSPSAVIADEVSINIEVEAVYK